MTLKNKKVRISAKAIIIRKGKLLLMRARDRSGVYYLLPGGGQNNGETLHEALVRECLEETGILVRPGVPRYIRDYVAKNHEFSAADKGFHQVEVMFLCEYIKRVKGGTRELDARQTGVSWIPLKKLGTIKLYPSPLKTLIGPTGRLSGQIYLGDSN
ncbi:MAG: NUDIX domain-containing protein [Elusimicrobiales bacterium]|nr:NUDIX domain-containing protein [Elusimicrobiales bacterium]